MTKQCKKCRQEIHDDASICQYCKSSQGKYDSIKGLAVAICFGLIIIGLMLFSIHDRAVKDNDFEITDTASIKITNITHGFGVTLERMQDKIFYDIYVVAEVENDTNYDLSNINIQFVFIDDANRVVDIVNGATNSLMKGGKKIIKVSGRAIKPQDQYKNIKTNIITVYARKSA